MMLYETPAVGILLGAILALAWVLVWVRDPGFREWSAIALFFCLGALGTLALLHGAQTRHEVAQASFFVSTPRLLFFMGVGMSLCCSISQVLWLLVRASIYRSSWPRRFLIPRLPPMESVSRALRCTSVLGSWTWGLGLLIILIWPAARAETGSILTLLLASCGVISITFLIFGEIGLIVGRFSRFDIQKFYPAAMALTLLLTASLAFAFDY